MRRYLPLAVFSIICIVALTAVVMYLRNAEHNKYKENYAKLNIVKAGDMTVVYSIDISHEDTSGILNPGTITGDKSFGGTHSCLLSTKAEYGTGFLFANKDEPLSAVRISAQIFTGDPGNAMWVAEINDSTGKNIAWYAAPFLHRKDEWFQQEVVIQVDSILSENNFIKVYSWNKSKRKIYIDDVSISFLKSPVR